jgi:hypothetical protein
MVAEDGGFASPRQGRPRGAKPAWVVVSKLDTEIKEEEKKKREKEKKRKNTPLRMVHDLTPNRTGYRPEIEYDRLTTVSGCAPALSGLPSSNSQPSFIQVFEHWIN